MPSLWQPLYTPSTVENTAPVWGSDVWGPPAPSTPSQGDMVSMIIVRDYEKISLI